MLLRSVLTRMAPLLVPSLLSSACSALSLAVYGRIPSFFFLSSLVTVLNLYLEYILSSDDSCAIDLVCVGLNFLVGDGFSFTSFSGFSLPYSSLAREDRAGFLSEVPLSRT